jgi:hypothetical protein
VNGQGALFDAVDDQLRELEVLRDPDEARAAPAHTRAADTEREAAALIAPRAGTWRRRVLEAVGRAGERGLTDWELHQALGGNLYTVAPRRKELTDDGWLFDCGERRMTNNGRRAIVWRLTSRGALQLLDEGAT